MGRDIHKYKLKVETELRKIMEHEDICQENKDIIRKFYSNCIMRDLSHARTWKYLFHLKTYAESFEKPFTEFTKDDIIQFIEHLEGQGYSAWTKHDNRVIMKSFFKWLNDGEYPEIVKWINTNIKGRKRRLPEEILTKEEIKKLIEIAETPRNKAFIYVLYESGCRIGEILTLNIKHVRFDEYGAILTVDGKTGMRRVRIIVSSSYLANWLEYHPFRDDPEYPLWINFEAMHKHQPLSYHGALFMLTSTGKKAGIKKKVNPQAFRRARATHLANKLTEAQMKEFFGWTKDSDMAAVYVHLSGRDVDNALLKIHGLVNEEEKKEETEMKTCQRCQEKNPSVKKFCGRCGTPLDLKDALVTENKYKRSDNMTYQIFKEMSKLNPEFERQMFQAMINLGMGGSFRN